MKSYFFSLILIVTLTFMSGGTAFTQENKKPSPENLRLYVDITLSGKVAEFKDSDEFILEYNNGRIAVDIKDEAYKILRDKHVDEVLAIGDDVIVTGVVDDNLFTGREIEAIIIKHQGVIYASQTLAKDTDRQILNDWYRDYETAPLEQEALDAGKARLVGTVTQVRDRNFAMQYEEGLIEVILPENHFPDVRKPVSVGDKVAVYGVINDTWFTHKKITAERLVQLSANATE